MQHLSNRLSNLKLGKLTKTQLALRFLVIICLAFLFTAYPVNVFAMPASQTWESYIVGDSTNTIVYGNLWAGQTFTVTPESHSIGAVALRLFRVGNPSTLTVSIRETSAGVPTGDDLTSGTIDGGQSLRT